METIVTLKTTNDGYDARDVLANTISVKEMIERLSQMPQNAKILFNNDNGYSFGSIASHSFRVTKIESYEEEGARIKKEEQEEMLEEIRTNIKQIKTLVNEENGEIILAMDGISLNLSDSEYEENLIVTELTTKINGSLYGNTNWGLINLEEVITDLDVWDSLYDSTLEAYSSK